VEGLGAVTPIVPLHVRVISVCDRVTLLTVDEVRELHRIFDEEHGRVVSNHIIVAFLSVVLQSETTWVTVTVTGSPLAGDGREAEESWRALADSVHELGLGVLAKIVCDLDITVGGRALGVDDTLGDALTVEMSELVNQGEVLEDDGATWPNSHRVLVVVDGISRGGGECFLLH